LVGPPNDALRQTAHFGMRAARADYLERPCRTTGVRETEHTMVPDMMRLLSVRTLILVWSVWSIVLTLVIWRVLYAGNGLVGLPRRADHPLDTFDPALLAVAYSPTVLFTILWFALRWYRHRASIEAL